MLYIQKTQPPQSLLNFIQTERGRGIFLPLYGSLPSNVSSDLRQKLFDEQRGLCCYCMKVITIGNSNIEHFLPQSIYLENEIDYYNLYLACRYSHGYPRRRQHCDIAKENFLIAKFVGYAHSRRCEQLFQYNEDGFILPAHDRHKTLDAFYSNFRSLNVTAKEALVAIEVLNLNVEDLRVERRNFVNFELLEEMRNILNDVAELQRLRRRYETEQRRKFAGVAIFFIEQRLRILARRTS